MRYIILIAVIAFLSASCTKTKIQTVTNNTTDTAYVHDTSIIYRDTTIILKTALIGNWIGDGDSIKFTKDSVIINGVFNNLYIASPDSVYWFLPSSGGIFRQYGYEITTDNNTLTLWPAISHIAYTYHRSI